jgi:hypothetical protein
MEGPARTVMEGDGAYNRHSAQQAAGAESALPLLRQAARNVMLGTPDQPIVVADYGSSQGRNSLAPMRAAIGILRERLRPETPICVVHTDLPDNDFSTLFHLIEDDAVSYLRAGPNVFASAVGRSFYSALFPPNHVTLGWSSYALMWPSRCATLVAGHIYSTRAGPSALAAFDQRADEDWANFLMLRARELRQGGRLVIVVAGRDDEGWAGIEPLMDHINAELAEMANDGSITAAERRRIVLPAHPKSRNNLLSPFDRSGRFAGLVMEHCDVSPGPDPVWSAYQVHWDPHKCAAQHAGFARAAFGPSFAAALDPNRTVVEQNEFNARLEAGVRHRMARNPMELRAVVGRIVIAKEAK